MRTSWFCVPAVLIVACTAQAQPQVQTEQTLAQKSGCLECHGVDKNINGPSLRDIAAKYKNDPRAREALIKTVKNGGKGNWTQVSRGVPMPPYVRLLSDAEIARLVDWILSR